MKSYTVYTDGSSFDDDFVGGWGVLIYPEFLGKRYDKLEFNGHYKGDSTSNRMELLAVINAVQQLPKNSHIKIYTDSKYILFGCRVGIDIWPQNDWISKTNQPIRDRNLWEKLHALIKKYDKIEFFWVKGHSDDADNTRADVLAKLGSYNKVICPRQQFQLFDVYIRCSYEKEDDFFSWKFVIKGNDFSAELNGKAQKSDTLNAYKKILNHIFFILEDREYEFVNVYSTSKVFKKMFEGKTKKFNFMHLYDQKIHPDVFNYYQENFM